TRYVEKAAAKIKSRSGLFTHNVIVRIRTHTCQRLLKFSPRSGSGFCDTRTLPWFPTVNGY
ncbi:hypothetical protein DOA62_23840, partial [Salmonella enterica subsp. enterica]|nr:hypothetical protein [Salmonella enterica subsp. enterica serovar Montevideo]